MSQDGTSQIGTCTNRWFDKLQLIVTGNGKAAINFEHTAVDGHTVLRFASDVFADTILRFAQSITRTTHGADYLRSVLDPVPKGEAASPVSNRKSRQASARDIVRLKARRLEFDFTPELKRSLFYAEVELSDLITQNETRVLEFEEFGKRFITSNKMSPDAFVRVEKHHLHRCSPYRITNTGTTRNDGCILSSSRTCCQCVRECSDETFLSRTYCSCASDDI